MECIGNEYNDLNTLFGPGASSTSGLGGIEVFPGQRSLDTFLGSVSASYSNRADVTIDGVPGVTVFYRGAQNGEAVVLFKDGTIYNLYIGSVQNDDLQNFSTLIASFKFLR